MLKVSRVLIGPIVRLRPPSPTATTWLTGSRRLPLHFRLCHSEGNRCALGPRQTGDFHKQFCDKNIKQYCNILIKQYFFCSKKCFCFSRSAEIAMNWDFQFTQWIKNVFLLQYRYIFLSQYCLQKLLVWQEPQVDMPLRRVWSSKSLTHVSHEYLNTHIFWEKLV